MRILFPVLIFIAAANPAGAAETTMPARFHGEWAVRLSECGSKSGDNTGGMTISDKAIGWYEESVAIRRVTVLGKDSVRYEGILSTYDGDEPASATLRLSPDGTRLIAAGYADGPNSPGPDLLRCTK